MPEVIMPKMGDAMTEGRILSWKKSPGDAVARGEPIAEIETDKVNVDLEAEDGGTLVQILVPAGEVVTVGAPIALIAAAGEAVPSPATPAAVAPADPATVSRPVTHAAATDAPAATAGTAGEVRASPLARRLAEQHGIALGSIRGSGPDGRITKEDVEAAIASGKPAAPQRTPPAPSAEPAVLPPPIERAEREIPLTRIRQTIARRMTESKQHTPHIYLTVSIEMDAAIALRTQLNEGADNDAKISLNDMVVKAAALALGKFPSLNSSFADDAVRQHGEINISIAVALPEGLIAPTLYHCDRKSLWEIATDAKALAERARTGHMRAADLTGGTFTISNLGMFGVEEFSAIINPPQAAILAVGAARPQAVVRDGRVVSATVMQVTCSADHRVTDGAEVARFLAEVKRLLENPVWLVAARP